MSDATDARPALRWLADARRTQTHTLARIDYEGVDADDPFACPLRWLGGDFRSETWRIAEPVTSGTAHGWQYRRSGALVFAVMHVDDGKDGSGEAQRIEKIAGDAYAGLFALQAELDLPCIQRIWHWLSAVTEGAGDEQRYQRFCRGRAEALDAPGQPMSTLPPATLVGSARRGVRLHALIGDSPVMPVENPRQISAYRYPRDYGLRAPAFARGGVVRLADSRYLLISGTASILGHASQHIGDIAAQAGEALNNVAAVIAAARPIIGVREAADLECLKAYIRDPASAETVLAVVRARMPHVPVALLHAPLCREELLVEFEGQIAL